MSNKKVELLEMIECKFYCASNNLVQWIACSKKYNLGAIILWDLCAFPKSPFNGTFQTMPVASTCSRTSAIA